MTYFTRHIYIRQEIHFDFDDAVAAARFTAAALYVEAEPAGFVATYLRFCRLAVQLSDEVEYARVCRWIGTRRPAYRRLVDIDDLVDILGPLDGLEQARTMRRAINYIGQPLVEDFINQRRFAGAGNASYDCQCPYGKFYVDIF